MNSRERIHTIVAGEVPDRPGFWLGNPHPDTWPLYLEASGERDEESVRRALRDDFRWICPQWNSYHHPEGKPMWDVQQRGVADSSPAVFTGSVDVAEVEAFDWPDPAHLDFTTVLEELRGAGDVYRASGFWCPFFHDLAAFMGMEEYFVKMHTHPDVVHAISRHIIDFYLEANRRFFFVAGDLVDAFFFGNDFGSQQGLLISPRHFEEFVASYSKELIAPARERGYQILLHSCGSVARVIPELLELPIDGLHPLQAKAAGMEAESLAAEFGGRLAFIGGIDTQELLVRGTPDEVRAEVERVKRVLGPHVVISPSHEALLPNVPWENVVAMAEAAVG
jgi:uroporphyrinogen decarboxylase